MIQAWPPEPIETDRVVLRAPCPADRTGVTALLTTPAVRTYLGGVRPMETVESTVDSILTAAPGLFSVQVERAFAGLVTVERRDPSRPSEPTLTEDVLELSYAFLPQFWGRGIAEEAASAVLSWATQAVPDELIVVCTQSANEPSIRLANTLGFRYLTSFNEFGADQWFGVRDLRPDQVEAGAR